MSTPTITPPPIPLTTEQQKEAAAQVAKSYAEAIENAKKLASLREKELATLQAENDLQDKINKFRKEHTDITSKQIEYEQQIEKINALRLKYQEEIKAGKQQEADQTKAQMANDKLALQSAKEALDVENNKLATFKNQVSAINNVGKALQKSFEDGENAAKKFFGVNENGLIKLAKESPEKAKEFVRGWLNQLKDLDTWLAGMQKGFKILLDGFNIPVLGTKIQGLRDMMVGILEAPAEAFKSFGFLDKYSDSIEGMRKSLRGAGVAEKDMHSAVGELNQSLADFSSYNKGTRDSLIETTAKLNLAGFSMKTVTTSMQILTKTFGQLPEQANQTTIRLAALSKTLGDGNKSFEDLVSLAPKLAVFGSKAIPIFEETAIAAKKLGLSTQQLYNIVEQYDTFEKAANAAGEFNLFLGGQFLDSLELMRAATEEGPNAVLKKLQDAFKQSGKDISALSPSMLKFAADAAKMDPQTFKRVFEQGSEGVEKYIKEQKEAEEKQANLNKISEKTQNIFQQIQNAFAKAFSNPEVIKSLTNIVGMMAKMSKLIAKAFSDTMKWIPLLITLFAVGKIASFLMFLGQAVKVMGDLYKMARAAGAAEAFLLGMTGGGLLLVAAGAAAAVTAYSVISSASGIEGDGEQPNIGAGGSPEITPVSPAEPAGDAFAPGGSIITTPSGRRIQTAGDDTVTAARNSTNGFGDLSKKFDILISKMDDLASRPVHVSMNGRKVSEEIAISNKYNPFVGNS